MSRDTSSLDIFYRKENGSLAANFQTDHLIIKSIEDSDFENIFSLQSNPTVMQHVGLGGSRNKDRIEAAHAHLVNLWKEGNPASAYMVFEKESNRFVGMGCLEEVLKDGAVQPGEAEVMLYLMPDFFRKGYGKELGNAFIQVICQAIRENIPIKVGGGTLSKLVGTAHPNNTASINLQRSLGFEEVGVGKKTVKGEEVDRVFFELDLERLIQRPSNLTRPSSEIQRTPDGFEAKDLEETKIIDGKKVSEGVSEGKV